MLQGYHLSAGEEASAFNGNIGKRSSKGDGHTSDNSYDHITYAQQAYAATAGSYSYTDFVF